MAAVARCLYCGVIGPWWDCGCKGATEAREGKRAKPRVRVIDGVTVIVVDDETAKANPLDLPCYEPGAAT